MQSPFLDQAHDWCVLQSSVFTLHYLKASSVLKKAWALLKVWYSLDILRGTLLTFPFSWMNPVRQMTLPFSELFFEEPVPCWRKIWDISLSRFLLILSFLKGGSFFLVRKFPKSLCPVDSLLVGGCQSTHFLHFCLNQYSRSVLRSET